MTVSWSASMLLQLMIGREQHIAPASVSCDANPSQWLRKKQGNWLVHCTGSCCPLHIMSIYRNAIWFLNGIQQYTRKGYAAASKDFETKDLDFSVVGRSFLITGANSGIGKATAMAIAKKGGTVHMVCRNKDRAEEAKSEIVSESGNAEVYIHVVDMSQTRKVWEFAEAFTKEHPSLNVLITVSSGGMLVQSLRADDLQSEKGHFDGVMVYAQNKRQQVVLTEHWAKANPVIHFSVMHPGWVDTPAVSAAMPQFHQMMGDRLRSVDQGADTVVWLALSRAAARKRSGRFFQDRKPVPTHLPLAWTHSSAEEIHSFITQLETLARAVQSRHDADLRGQTDASVPQFV
ncbi:PREDICTED: dehydrogenase/reductase SDR family member 12-like isoform X2 [Poecilia mexicana]|uniref:dehydrogenase/reductase SDR family member 12-like isoform X2 n=1 Tax=Poecilia mexicana TaxID=48701 RepID=UPI00072E1508|nr:PREDICTED: dehydrogenase/reductase SDR family member 12-like isoform X2 [Poecilia mexicana]